MSLQYLIIGNGAAGVSAAEAIREADPAGRITIVSAEPYNMYSRPGLAYVLTGAIPPEQTITRTDDWYDSRDIQLKIGRVVRLHAATQHIVLEDGTSLSYDRLLVASGARATPPPYPGADLHGVVYLDTMDGTKEMLKLARKWGRAVIIGGGITALEMCEGLAARGMEVHYFLRRERLWDRVFNESEGELLASKMKHHGIILHRNTEISRINGNWRGRVRSVTLQDGSAFKCNLLGVAIGVRPQLEFLIGSALKTDRGILVNEHMQANVPNIFAAGDVAQVYDRWSGSHQLDVLWPSAVAEGRIAGRNMAGDTKAYEKGTPFNVCLLFGLHITAIGQVHPEWQSEEPVQHLSRGSSEVWFTFPRHYRSAWSRKGDTSLRLVADKDRLVGALLIGERSFADVLRGLISEEVDIRPVQPFFEADRDILMAKLSEVWQRHERQKSWP